MHPDLCHCHDEWIGNECEEPICFGKNANNEDQCSGHGNCTSVDTCNCETYFYGFHCEEGFVWKEESAPSFVAGRYSHSLVLYEDQFWMFGGPSDTSSPYELVSFSFDMDSITSVDEITQGNPPSGRYDHCAVVYLDAMWMYGGRSSVSIMLNEFRRFNFTVLEWTSMTATPSPTVEIQGHSCVAFQDKMWIFGGVHNDVHGFSSLNFLDAEWINYDNDIPVKEHSHFDLNPLPRRRHAAVVYKDSMWVLGGRDAEETDFELWTLSLPN